MIKIMLLVNEGNRFFIEQTEIHPDSVSTYYSNHSLEGMLKENKLGIDGLSPQHSILNVVLRGGNVIYVLESKESFSRKLRRTKGILLG